MKNSENIEGERFGYLISTKEGESMNRTMYKMAQIPTNWIRKGMQHQRDAEIMYQNSNIMRERILFEMGVRKFNFGYFFRHDLTGMINEILYKNPDIYIPDYDGFYNFVHLGFENIFKGIWLDKNIQLIGFDQLPVQIQTHDLSKLANYIGLKINKTQKDLLEKVHNLYMGYGRYPINTKLKVESSFRDLDFCDRNFESVCFDLLSNEYEEDREVFAVILKKMSKIINKIYNSEGFYIEEMFNLQDENASV